MNLSYHPFWAQSLYIMLRTHLVGRAERNRHAWKIVRT